MQMTYVLKRPSSERDTRILKARVDPSWMRHKAATQMVVTYTELKGMFHV